MTLDNLDISPYDIISLDVFDTAIFRKVGAPKHVFRMLEKRYYEEGFATKREQAETVARDQNKDSEEVTLRDIYDALGLLEDAMDNEIKTEYLVCYANPDVMNFLHRCLDANKKIIFITDMYLPRYAVENILSSNGFGSFSHLFISSESGKTKHTGNLFREVKGIFKRQNILHVGDNIHSDVRMAKSVGIESYHYDICREHDEGFLRPFLDDLKYSDDITDGLIYSKCRDMLLAQKDNYHSIGYIYLGPMLYGFLLWLSQAARRDGVEKLVFLSRDGFLIKKAYDMFDNALPSDYGYSSRRMLSIALLGKDESIAGRLIQAFKKPMFTRASAIELGIALDEMSGLDIKSQILEHASQESENAIRYYREIMGQYQKIGLVDIGWLGNCQDYIQRLLDQSNLKFQGYLFGAHKAAVLENIEGYYAHRGSPKKNAKLAHDGCEVFETLFSAPHRSVQSIDDELQPVYIEDEGLPEHVVEGFHDGALDFIRDVKKEELLADMDWQAFGKRAATFLVGRPGKVDALTIGQIEHSNMAGNAKKSHLIYGLEKYDKSLLDKIVFILLFRKSYWIGGSLALMPKMLAVTMTSFFPPPFVLDIVSYIRRKGVIRFVRRSIQILYQFAFRAGR